MILHVLTNEAIKKICNLKEKLTKEELKKKVELLQESMKDCHSAGEVQAFEENKEKINSLIEFVADSTEESKDEIEFKSEELNNNQFKY